MAEAYYEPTPATDGATMNPVPGAVFQVFEIADTTFTTPLSLRVGSGNPTTSVTASDTLATLPGVYVTSPNYEHIWKSGTFEWRRDSIDGAKKAIEDAKLAASNSASSASTAATNAATSAQAAQDAAALVDAPADTTIQELINTEGSATRTALSATYAHIVNMAKYAALDGATDDAPALAQAVAEVESAGGGTIVIPEGKTLHLNSPTYLASNVADLMYSIRGEGRGSKITLGTGLAGKFAVYLNETSTGAQVLGVGSVRQRLLVENLRVHRKDGGVLNASWVKTDGAGVTHRRIKFSGLLYGLRSEEYLDMVRWDEIEWRDPQPNGWMWQSDFHGDGVDINQVFATAGAPVVKLSMARGGTISNCIGGVYQFSRCQNIEYTAAHIEDHAVGGTTPYCLVEDSHVVFRNNHWWGARSGAPIVTIDDDPARFNLPKSDVVFEDNTFSHVLSDLYNRVPDIHIKNATEYTRVRFSRNAGLTITTTGWNVNHTGLNVTAVDPAIQAAIDARSSLLAGNVELVREGVNGWVLKTMDGVRAMREQAAPSLAVTDSPDYPGSITSGTTYYYNAVAISPDGATLPGAERTATAAASNRSLSLYVGLDVSPARLGVWRGTAPGVYDSYVEIPVSARRSYLFDEGSRLSGIPWRTTSIPALPTATALVDGVSVNGRRIGWEDNAPLAGTWKRGDIVFNTGSAATVGWRCSSGGTPGTWTAFS